jgi:hypothetical protein
VSLLLPVQATDGDVSGHESVQILVLGAAFSGIALASDSM